MARGRHFVQDLWASCTPADPLVLWRSGPALQAAHVPQPEHPRGNAACCTLQERGRQFETRQGQPRCTCEAVTRARLSCSQHAASCLQGVDVRECCAHAFQCIVDAGRYAGLRATGRFGPPALILCDTCMHQFAGMRCAVRHAPTWSVQITSFIVLNGCPPAVLMFGPVSQPITVSCS